MAGMKPKTNLENPYHSKQEPDQQPVPAFVIVAYAGVLEASERFTRATSRAMVVMKRVLVQAIHETQQLRQERDELEDSLDKSNQRIQTLELENQNLNEQIGDATTVGSLKWQIEMYKKQISAQTEKNEEIGRDGA